MWVLVTEAVLTCTHNQYFEQKQENSQKKSKENCHFYRLEKTRYVVLAYLTHLSRRLKGELIVYLSSCRLCVCVCVCVCVYVCVCVCKHFQLEYLRNQWANRNEIFSEPSLGLGKGYISFWARSDRNLVSMETDSSHRVIMGKML